MWRDTGKSVIKHVKGVAIVTFRFHLTGVLYIFNLSTEPCTTHYHHNLLNIYTGVNPVILICIRAQGCYQITVYIYCLPEWAFNTFIHIEGAVIIRDYLY